MKEEIMRTTKMRSWIIITMLMVCLIGACSWQISREATAEMMKLKELELRGEQLRKAIDETYKKLDDIKELKNMGGGYNIITDVVVKYIPIGTSFDDAEEILQAAGFKVGKRYLDPLLFRHNGTQTIGSYSKINNYKQLIPLFSNTSVGVLLEPKNKDDWSTVHNLEADIGIIYL